MSYTHIQCCANVEKNDELKTGQQATEICFAWKLLFCNFAGILQFDSVFC
jgi:hypothetical protein